MECCNLVNRLFCCQYFPPTCGRNELLHDRISNWVSARRKVGAKIFVAGIVLLKKHVKSSIYVLCSCNVHNDPFSYSSSIINAVWFVQRAAANVMTLPPAAWKRQPVLPPSPDWLSFYARMSHSTCSKITDLWFFSSPSVLPLMWRPEKGMQKLALYILFKSSRKRPKFNN